MSDKEHPTPRRIHISYPDAAQGKEIYNYFGNRVLEHTTSTGAVLAIKVNPVEGMQRSEADMMHSAATNGVMAPKVRCVYDLVTRRPIARAMVSERLPGMPLDEVWADLTDDHRAGIKDQLRVQLARMKACTQPFIERLGRQPTRNVYDRIPETYCGPFADEEEFDKWCLSRVGGGPFIRWKWQRRNSSSAFVLTHGDLAPRNILVYDGVMTGIVDWEASGFFPEYAEYAFVKQLVYQEHKWWIPILDEVLQLCLEQRLEFTYLAMDRAF
ncbi:Uncharacterized protein TPAR_03500 [Tolypocladium paradoxum]|uniref:Aminoglycoside phosphotransferase domain-containing protein n=1 Tax=Tolypocladium paradoxum TaxID=94208 RepID=A0A2S4L1G6_9HYPO|nr:Uncharacterized protein TPAR_03500 [Tolypocladium paradoxum]